MLKIPLHSLVIMVGPAGAGKKAFVDATFRPHEIVSYDSIRYEPTH